MTDRFDAAGTQPGLTGTSKEPKTVNLKCRSPRKCDSIEATEVPLEGAAHHGQHIYRCVKCGHTWGANLGGHLDI